MRIRAPVRSCVPGRVWFMKRILLFIPMISIVVLTLSAAESAGPSAEKGRGGGTNVVSIEALVAEALEKNPELRFYEAEISAARATAKFSGKLPPPEMEASVGHKSVRDSGVSGEGVAWSVALRQPIEWPGRLGLRKAIANRDIELAELGLRQFRAALAGKVRSAAHD